MDFDGTLCEYRYNDRVLGDQDIGGQTRADLLFGNTFLNARPLEFMKNFLNNFDFNNIYILGQIVSSHEIDQKFEWLKINYPKLKKEICFLWQSQSKNLRFWKNFASIREQNKKK